MANEYLIKKWKLWFKFLDKQHKGHLSKEDEKLQEETFVNLANLEGEREKEAREVLRKHWGKIVFHGKDGPITEQEFVDMTNKDFNEGKDNFEVNVRKLSTEHLKVIGQAGEGYVTEESFFNALKSEGFENDDWIKKYFQAYSPVDGKVPIEKMANAWVQFCVNEDSSKKDIVLENLEEYFGQ